MNQFIVIHSPEQNIKYEEHSVGDRTPSETLLELLLKVHRKPGSILCGCQFQNGQSLLLKFVRYGDKSRRRYRLDRRHKSDNHADDCFSRMPDSQQSRTDNPTSLGLSAATFALLTQAPAKSPPPQNRPNPEREAERRTPRATFARFTTDIQNQNTKSARIRAQRRPYKYFVIKGQGFMPGEPAVEISTPPKVDFYFQDRS